MPNEPEYILVEAVNIDATVFDTTRISVIRGGALCSLGRFPRLRATTAWARGWRRCRSAALRAFFA